MGMVKWGDEQQYKAMGHSEGMEAAGQERHGVMPTVHLLGMTPDPLGHVAAMAAMYEGRPVASLDVLDDDDRRHYWDQVLATHLDTPLEAVQLHFLLSGVDRAFTHQLVRQRVGSAYAQESLRFAVPDDLRHNTSLPPSLWGTELGTPLGAEPDQAHYWRNVWDQCLEHIDQAYGHLVASGMPAEEARGLLPHAMATRIHYVTNLRALSKLAGERLCTQAQFHWRMVVAAMANEIRHYDPTPQWLPESTRTIPVVDAAVMDQGWQYTAIADSNLFRPVCYQEGKCPFKADFDRACTIRPRVDAFHSHGVPSSQWGDGFKSVDLGNLSEHPRGSAKVDYIVEPIRNDEWALNVNAARKVT
jgi:thymidylate synthase (FAD)